MGHSVGGGNTRTQWEVANYFRLSRKEDFVDFVDLSRLMLAAYRWRPTDPKLYDIPGHLPNRCDLFSTCGGRQGDNAPGRYFAGVGIFRTHHSKNLRGNRYCLQEFCDRCHSNVGMYVLKCLRIALTTIFDYKHYKAQSRSRLWIVASVWVILHMRVKVATTALETRLLCGSHTMCLQAESMLAWLAACWWAWPVCLHLSQGARK